MKAIPINIVTTFLFAYQDVYYINALFLDPQAFIFIFTFTSHLYKLTLGYFFKTHFAISHTPWRGASIARYLAIPWSGVFDSLCPSERLKYIILHSRLQGKKCGDRENISIPFVPLFQVDMIKVIIIFLRFINIKVFERWAEGSSRLTIIL